MSDEQMIDVFEAHDQNGNFIVRARGQYAPTLAQLAKLLGVPEDRFRFNTNPKLGDRERARFRAAEAAKKNKDWSVFDPTRDVGDDER